MHLDDQWSVVSGQWSEDHGVHSTSQLEVVNTINLIVKYDVFVVPVLGQVIFFDLVSNIFI